MSPRAGFAPTARLGERALHPWIAPPPGSILGHLKVMNLKDVDPMMKITLTIGVVHIVLANLMRGVHGTTPSGRFQPLGWCLVALGGL